MKEKKLLELEKIVFRFQLGPHQEIITIPSDEQIKEFGGWLNVKKTPWQEILKEIHDTLEDILDYNINVSDMEDFIKNIGLDKKIKFIYKKYYGHHVIIKNPQDKEMLEKVNMELSKLKAGNY